MAVQLQEPAVQIARDAAAKRAADASAMLAKMKADYDASPDQQAARARGQLAQHDADPFHQNARMTSSVAQQEIAALQAQLRLAEAGALADVVTDEQRLDQAISGLIHHSGVSVASGTQIPQADFAGAIADDLALGIREDLVRAYHLTGKSDDPEGHIHAATWFRLYENSPDWQRLHREHDPVISRRFRYACIYAAG